MTSATEATFELYIAGLQRSVAGVCVALLVAGGLISVPTSCDCGAGVAHGHSLFVLSGHHHGAESVTFGRQKSDHGHYQHMQGSPSVEPQLMGRISHGSDRVAVALPQFDVSATTWQRVMYAPVTDVPGTGQVVVPDAPPPKNISRG